MVDERHDGRRSIAECPRLSVETTILFAAIGTLLGMLGLNKLPRLHNPLNKSHRFLRATADRFFIVISAEDEIFDRQKTETFLKSIGSTATELVNED